MNKLVMIRHAPTKYNINGVFMGRMDCDIDEAIDKQKIDSLKSMIEMISPSRVFSSPLIRCKKTAALIAPNRHIIYDSRIMEKDLGEWSGKQKEYIKKMFPNYFDANGALNIMLTPPGGEDFSSFAERVKAFVLDAFVSQNDETVVAITHCGVIATMIDYFCDRRGKDNSISTKKISHLDYFVFCVSSSGNIYLEE